MVWLVSALHIEFFLVLYIAKQNFISRKRYLVQVDFCLSTTFAWVVDPVVVALSLSFFPVAVGKVCNGRYKMGDGETNANKQKRNEIDVSH